MKKYVLTLSIMVLFAIGFAASDESESSNVDKQEQTQEEEQTREKTEYEIIGDLAYKEGADFAREDRGEFFNNFIRSGLNREGAEGQFKVYVRGTYRADNPDASDELVQIYAQKYFDGYMSVLK